MIAAFTKPASLTENRDGWEIILRKLRAGEMPPKGIPRPAQLDAAIQFLQAEFDKADRNVKPDPGRVTARRLNRAEYTNTIRDLLAVDFRAEKSFPTDDLGSGFDNVGDVLTVSPVLMEKYLSAAQQIAGRAIASGPLPKPLEKTYALKFKNVQRLDVDTIEAPVRIDFDGDYEIHFGLQGERGPDAKPVKLAFYMDGKLLQTINAETKPSKLVYFDPYSEETMRLPLTEGDHVFRAAFLDDDFRQDTHRQGSLRPQEEQVPRFDDLPRALPIEDGKGQPQEDPHLRSELRSGVRGKNRFHAGPPRLPPPGYAKGSGFAHAVHHPGEIRG